MNKEKAIREHISFAPTERDRELHEYFLEQSKKYGKSSYIKILIEEDMKKNEDNKRL